MVSKTWDSSSGQGLKKSRAQKPDTDFASGSNPVPNCEGEVRVNEVHIVGEAWDQFCREKKGLIEKSFIDVGLNIASNGLEDSKLSIKGYDHSKLEIGDWSRIDDKYEGFQEVPKIDKLDEFIQEEEVCITTNYRGLTRPRLQDLMKERKLKGVSKKRAEMVEILQKDDQISQVYCTE